MIGTGWNLFRLIGYLAFRSFVRGPLASVLVRRYNRRMGGVTYLSGTIGTWRALEKTARQDLVTVRWTSSFSLWGSNS
jgi:hypothetical protein